MSCNIIHIVSSYKCINFTIYLKPLWFEIIRQSTKHYCLQNLPSAFEIVDWPITFLFDRSELQDDDDVVAEREKVQIATENHKEGENQVLISGLTKYFLTRKAVNDVYLAIPKGECFGLLGKFW